ncbi:MAG TPA: ABC transporter permease [Xanthobacteraceae bacterium]|jgi:cell division transport system permease protein|nr:ABC transporter permease [Xanthobacteraceae bacterium]
MVDYQHPDLPSPAPAPMRSDASIVPKNSIAGSALIAVVAIMTFLASLITGVVMLVIGSTAEWQSEVAREMTIQVRPTPNRPIDDEVAKAVAVARAARGVAEVRPYSRQDSARLLEPWIGTGLAIDDLPVPRIIVLRLQSGIQPDVAALRTALAQQVAGATLDDHGGWVDRMRTMAGSAIAIGIGMLALMLTATILSVAFATRGAMAANRPIVEVLHFVGARDGYIARQFQRHFLALGLKGGAIGGGAAIALFALAQLLVDRVIGTAGGEQIAALFGSFSIGALGYGLIALQIVVNAIVTAGASREVVNRTLATVA